MSYTILADTVASVSELKKNPMRTIAEGEGFPVAILNRNKPSFYCVPAEQWEQICELLEDIELGKLVKERQKEKRIKVDFDEL